MIPATLAQQGIWFSERLEVGTVYSMPFSVTFDEPVDAEVLGRACQEVLARHPVLTCSFTEQDGMPLLEPGPAPELVEVAPDRVDDFIAQEIGRPFDLAAGPLIRLTLIRGTRLLVVVHHAVFDGESTSVFLADLAEALDDRLAKARTYWDGRWSEPGETVLPGLTGTAPIAGPGAALEFDLDLVPLDDASRFEIILASLHALLFRYGNREPVVGVDLGTRRDSRIGVFVNELPVITSPTADQSFRKLLSSLREDLRELYRIRDVPLSRAVNGVRPTVAIAPVTLGYRRRGEAPDFGVPATVDWALFNGTVRGALRVHIVDGPDRCRVALHYDPARMSGSDISRLAGHWRTLLGGAVTAPDTPLADLPLMGLDELSALSVSNRTSYPPTTLTELFAAQVAATPEAPAVTWQGRTLTYQELNAEVERVAAELGGSGGLVAVDSGRSLDTLVGQLAVLRAGAAYVPLDPTHPAERTAFMLADSKAIPLRTGEPGPLPGLPGPDDLAYVLYTSGSTGRPKGVAIEHRSLANLLLAMKDLLQPGPDDVWLALTSPSFDISALELYLPLVTGGRVVIAPDAADGKQVVQLVRDQGVTHVQATPTGWRLLLDSGFAEPVTALAGGEALPRSVACELGARVKRLFTVYGPTETTIWSTAAELVPPIMSVPLGEPLANTSLHVLDAGLRPVPLGVPGELCIGGAGLARGYLGRPELTADRFVDSTYGRIYRTGDLVRRSGDGHLEFLGRIDGQVKLRGHRVELGEIENRMLEHPEVGLAAVVVRDDVLVGYVTPAVPSDLAERLTTVLPSYMVPAILVGLDELPLTPNGKLDRRALPDPPAAAPARYQGLEEAVHEIWAEVMNLDTIGPDDDLLALGAHSLTITRISARILDRLGVELPLHTFYASPTIPELAAAVARQRGDA